MACAFCEIAAGTRPAAFVWEDRDVLAFLDTRPLFPGHTLLIPREHIETLPELPRALLAPLFSVAQRLALAMETALDAKGSFVAINNRISQSVPHLHVHVVPRRPKDGLKGFFWPRGKYQSDEEMLAVQDALRTALAVSG